MRFGTWFEGFELFFRGFSILNAAVWVCDAAKMRCRVPNWLGISGFAWWVAAVANWVLRV